LIIEKQIDKFNKLLSIYIYQAINKKNE
jgi:hypothetical protein